MKQVKIVSLMGILTMIVLNPGYAQDMTFEREIIVMFKPGVIQLPPGISQARLPDIAIAAPGVKSALERRNTEFITKAFPNFKLADTLGVARTGEVVRLTDLSNIYTIRFPEKRNIPETASELSTFPEVIYAEPNGMAIPQVIYPNDPHFDNPSNPGQGGYQWNLLNTGQSGGTADADIDVPEAWDITTGSSNTTIGIIDFGVWSSHEDLSGKVSGDAGINASHGTHVAGIAAAKTNNTKGIAGIDWNAQIEAQRIDNVSGDPGIAAAVYDAVSNGSDIINNSWILCNNCNNNPPDPRYSTTVRIAFADAYRLNVIAAVAMGNYNSNTTYYPAGFGQGIVAVGATNRSDIRWDDGGNDGSSYGSHIDVTAPGVDILSSVAYYSSIYSGYYDSYTGTSMAAPHISGIAGLLLAENPNLYNDDIEQIIRLSADKVSGMGGQDWTTEYGTGRVNARKALDLIRSPNVLSHAVDDGLGGLVSSPSAEYTMNIYSALELQNGQYRVRRHWVKKWVTFPSTYASAPDAWGRGVGSIGWANLDSASYNMNWCEVYNITTTGATLRTYVYEVRTMEGDWIGWYPMNPANVFFQYTVLGVPWEPPSDPAPAAPTSLIIANAGQVGRMVRLSWNANTEPDLDHYNVWRKCQYGVYFVDCNLHVIGSTTSTSYTDWEVFIDVNDGSTDKFTYYVTAVDEAEQESGYSNSAVTWGSSFEKSITAEPVPDTYALKGNYPNPFNPSTRIHYDLPEASRVSLVIYDVMGREIRSWSATEEPGFKSRLWNGRNNNGRPVPGGIYIYRLVATSVATGEIFTASEKMVFLK